MSSAFINPLAPRSFLIIEKARSIKAWVRDILCLEPDIVVSVSELSCTLPNCPPKETIILIMSHRATRQISIHKAIAEIDRHEVVLACSQDDGLVQQ